jgi:hypothetical protein
VRNPHMIAGVEGLMNPTTDPRRTLQIVHSDKTTRRDTHVRKEDAPVGPGINAQTPDSMPRAEDDVATRAHSPEFHDRPGSGKHTADRQRVF